MLCEGMDRLHNSRIGETTIFLELRNKVNKATSTVENWQRICLPRPAQKSTL